MNEFQLARDHAVVKSNATWDAMILSWSIKRHWGLRIDWHVCSYALEDLVSGGVLKTIGKTRGGFTVYAQV